MEKYQIREIHQGGVDSGMEYKKIRVYESMQHIWSEVYFTVSPKNKNLGDGWYSEKGARVIFL
jgi:hypothetical protein